MWELCDDDIYLLFFELGEGEFEKETGYGTRVNKVFDFMI